jgi:hypothetical protein
MRVGNTPQSLVFLLAKLMGCWRIAVWLIFAPHRRSSGYGGALRW